MIYIISIMGNSEKITLFFHMFSSPSTYSRSNERTRLCINKGVDVMLYVEKDDLHLLKK